MWNYFVDADRKKRGRWHNVFVKLLSLTFAFTEPANLKSYKYEWKLNTGAPLRHHNIVSNIIISTVLKRN